MRFCGRGSQGLFAISPAHCASLGRAERGARVVKYETYGVCGSAGAAGTGVGSGVKVGVADGVDTVSGAALANEAEGRGDGERAVWLWLERNATVVDARATLAISTRRPATAGRFIASTRRFIAITYKTPKSTELSAAFARDLGP